MAKDGPDDTFIYTSTFVLAIVTAIVIILLFSSLAQPGRIFEGIFFKILWLVVPLCVYLISAGISLAGQHFLCGNISLAKAFTTSLSTLGLLYTALFIPSQFPVARMPVGSIFVSKFARSQRLLAHESDRRSLEFTRSQRLLAHESDRRSLEFTRAPNPDLYQVESANPTLMGASFAYYAFWGVLFGQIIGSNLSAACG